MMLFNYDDLMMYPRIEHRYNDAVSMLVPAAQVGITAKCGV